jgi:predicted transcriptional regulator
MSWHGRGGPTDRAIYGATLDIAATYGTIGKKGVFFSADIRTLALKAGVGSLKTVHKSLQRLREDWGLIRLSKKGTGKRAAVYLLRYPGAAQGGNTKQCAIYVPPLSQMRNPGPVTEREFDKNGRKIPQQTRYLLRRLGKLVALVVERVAVAGDRGLEDLELACELERRLYNVRRVLQKALEGGLVVEGEDGRFRTPKDLEWRLKVELEESGCNEARERASNRYQEEREAFHTRRERRPDQGPTEEDLAQERLQRVQDALDILQDPGTGPAMILESYLSGETHTFDYVVSAVAFRCGCAGTELWREPVKRAVELIAGPSSAGVAGRDA